ncbi:MAG: long-chain fatty acid--CoA ligase [Proteobacteria bacterium]|nr:MAG: long-chain fatty acid--CoA ligase [Pseudomonadota bacterium]QKK10552.1 MAG: AMP-binding protein [Pseudomonadota bacterium]
MPLDTLIAHHARYRPDKLALIHGESRLTYAEFQRAINHVANALLANGIGKGDKVATVLPNSLELITLYWAITRIGAVIVPMSPLLQPSGLLGLLQDCDARMVFLTAPAATGMAHRAKELRAIREHDIIVVDGSVPGPSRTYDELLAGHPATDPPRADLDDDDLFNIVYSSGTTGTPKGIMHSHGVRTGYATHFAAAFRMTPESVELHAGSIVFNGAFVTLMPCFYLGATYVLEKSFAADAFIATIERERATHVMLVPSQIVAILESPTCSYERLQSLEMVLSLGAPLHQIHKDRLTQLLPGRFYELYGLTEGFVTVLDREDYPRKPRSVGCPLPLSEMRIVDDAGNEVPTGTVGEITGRGPLLMPGYYKRPDLTRQSVRDGWLHSGDLGYVDEAGFLYLVDRKKDMIISGGVNVYPRDIEEVAVQHPDVVEAAVFGVTDDKWGESPVAAVVLREGADLAETALREWINTRVAAKYQRVARVLILKGFPRNVAGKVLKNQLAELFNGDR